MKYRINQESSRFYKATKIQRHLYLFGLGLMIAFKGTGALPQTLGEELILGDDEEKIQVPEDNTIPITPFLGAFPDPRQAKDNVSTAIETPFGQLKWADISKGMYEKQGAFYYNTSKYVLKLTLEPYLQNPSKKLLESQKYITGAFSVVENQTGKILVMVEKRGDPSPLLINDDLLTTATAPAASLMKIVTASAALEADLLSPSDNIYFNGGCGKLRGQNWLRDDRSDKQKMTLARAFGTSCNTAFARIAIYVLGLSSLKHQVEGFLFNKPIKSDLVLESSSALMPSLETATSLEVAEMGAGFGASKISPLHAALLSAPAGNKGVIPVPRIVDEAYDSKGQLVYKSKYTAAGTAYSATTASKMLDLMQETTLTGTSRKFFRKRQNSKLRYEIGGKTGTLSDAEERGTLYTWYSGIAPLEAEKSIAIGALISSPKTHVLRASMLAQQVLALHLNRLSLLSAKTKAD